jgi:hypothetical protein
LPVKGWRSSGHWWVRLITTWAAPPRASNPAPNQTVQKGTGTKFLIANFLITKFLS